MVEIMNPTRNSRVLDPACGSGGFLVMVLDHVRRQITESIYPDRTNAEREVLANEKEINDMVRRYAESMLFGFDFDPDFEESRKDEHGHGR